MLLSQLARKFAVGSCLALALPAISIGQTITPQGGEYAVVGALPGDQVKPDLAIGSGGGYLVWQDNATDGDGWGIKARVLDSHLQGSLPPFRVNSIGKYDQENARVALLNNGGAVFVWQGGRQGFQHIYARFLSPTNTWLALDQMVNSSGKLYQANPQVAALKNGNVVIVYATYNTNTMQDVYGQIFSPDGQKVGTEFQLNQFTAYNQRTPAVTAFNDGFIAAWVSEQQRVVGAASVGLTSPSDFVLPSVDVYARTFDAGGNPSGAEFLVNTSSNACANPVVAAGNDGSVMFCWSGADAQVRHNSWDVYSRVFTFSGGIPLAGFEQRVNTQLYGDQFGPVVAVTGTNYFLAWTSMGQDGSGRGVYAQVLHADGSRSGVEFRVNTTTFASQQEPTVAPDNAGRFLAVWTSPTYSPSRNDLFGQIYAGSDFISSAAATNYGSPLFVGEPAVTPPVGVTNGSYLTPNLELPTLDYPGVVSHGGSDLPATNAFTLAAGTYSGLFYDAKGVAWGGAGSVSVSVKANKQFTIQLSLGGKPGSASGMFDDLGAVTKIISVPGAGTLLVTLQLDLFGGNQISGKVAFGSNWSAILLADRQSSSATTYAGSYSVIIPGARTGPGGSGYGTVTVTTAGAVKFSGKLADGTVVSQGSTVSQSGVWPLFCSSGSELVMGWVQFESNPAQGNSGGDLVWIKPASKPPYPGGFTNEVSAVVGLSGTLAQGARSLQLTAGGLSDSVQGTATIGPNSKVLTRSANIKSLSINSSGVFTGSATVGTKTLSFGGALLGGSGEGYFLNGNDSGKVKLE